jgi:hypothetical protein
MTAAQSAYRTLANTATNPGAPGSSHRDDPGVTFSNETVILSGARSAESKDLQSSATYLLPLGTRVRAMFKMDFAEALYIAELRSGIAGHFSYRRVAWEMYLAVAKRHPALASCFRIEDVNQPIDLLKR